MLNTSRATREQIHGWVANRTTTRSPSREGRRDPGQLPDREIRRGWVQRILDHDGFE